MVLQAVNLQAHPQLAPLLHRPFGEIPRHNGIVGVHNKQACLLFSFSLAPALLLIHTIHACCPCANQSSKLGCSHSSSSSCAWVALPQLRSDAGISPVFFVWSLTCTHMHCLTVRRKGLLKLFLTVQGSNANGTSKQTSLPPNGGLSFSGQCFLRAHGDVSFHLHVLFQAE